MNTVLRTLAAILAGMLAVFLLVVAVEVFGSVVHPLPKDFGGTMEEMCRHVERSPTWVLAAAVPMWGAAAFAGAWTARRIGNLWSFAIVGLLVLAGLLFNISKLPYPMWFKVACLLVIPGAIVLGGRLASRRQAAALPSRKPDGAPREI
jgi:hypothetical protein